MLTCASKQAAAERQQHSNFVAQALFSLLLAGSCSQVRRWEAGVEGHIPFVQHVMGETRSDGACSQLSLAWTACARELSWSECCPVGAAMPDMQQPAGLHLSGRRGFSEGRRIGLALVLGNVETNLLTSSSSKSKRRSHTVVLVKTLGAEPSHDQLSRCCTACSRPPRVIPV